MVGTGDVFGQVQGISLRQIDLLQKWIKLIPGIQKLVIGTEHVKNTCL